MWPAVGRVSRTRGRVFWFLVGCGEYEVKDGGRQVAASGS